MRKADRLPAPDPEVAAHLQRLAEAQIPAYETMTPAEARQAMAARAMAAAGPRAECEARDLVAAGGIRLRIYRPAGSGSSCLPFLVYFHGGGWVLGSLDTHDGLCRALCAGSGCAVVAVDYRLAPEARFPAAVEDAEAAALWILDHARELALDPAAAAVGGDSAGGTLAAVVAIALKGHPVPLRFQMLLYPCTDMNMDRGSYAVSWPGLPVTAATMRWFRSHYLRSPADQRDWRASPILAEDLAGLPPALIVTAGYDPLADDGAAYCERLRDAGVSAERWHFAGQIHGFLNLGLAIPSGLATIRDLAAALRAELATSGAA